MDLTVENLTEKMEAKFGKLNPQAKHCVEDIIENYNKFLSEFQNGKIEIISSSYMISNKINNSSRFDYQTLGGLSIIILITGLILIFFNWKYSVVLFLTSFILKKISNKIKTKKAINFSEEIRNKIINNPSKGIIELCEYYIAGIIQLSSSNGKAHLPLIPSCSLTGKTVYARNE